MSPTCPFAEAVREGVDVAPLAALRELVGPAAHHALTTGCLDCTKALRAAQEAGLCLEGSPMPSPWPAEPELEGRADEVAAKLVEMPVSRRRMYLHESRTACTRPVVEALIARSRSRLSTDPAGAVEIAELAVSCADAVRPGHYAEEVWSDLQAIALCALGGAQRRAGDLRTARKTIEEAEAAASLGTSHPKISLDLLEKKGWLAIDRGRTERALELFSEGVEVARTGGDRHLRGRALYNRSVALKRLERLREALADLHTAAMILDPDRDPRLVVVVSIGLAECHEAAGNLVTADDYLRRVERLWDAEMNDGDRIRVAWNRGRICAAAGDLARADAHYRRARRGFVDLGYPLDGATVTLELAATLAEQERWGEVSALAAEMIEVFRASGVENEGLAAAYLLRTSRSVGTVHTVAEAISRLKSSDRSFREA